MSLSTRFSMSFEIHLSISLQLLSHLLLLTAPAPVLASLATDHPASPFLPAVPQPAFASVDKTAETGQASETPGSQLSVEPELKSLLETGEPKQDTSNLPSSLLETPITSVTQLSDVLPTDWAYQALQSLVERYGCLVGYSHRQYLGNRVLSRSEFAAGLNACLNHIRKLVAQTSESLAQADLDILQRLQSDFNSELIALRGRVDGLEARLAELQAQEFSPTARLNVLSSFNVSQAFADGEILAEGIPVDVSPAARVPLRVENAEGELEPILDTVTDTPVTTFSYSTFLLFSASFTGDDELTTLLAVGNGDPPASVYSSAGFTSSFGIPYADSNPVTPLNANQVGAFELKYTFSVGDDLQLTIGPRILPYRHFDLNSYTNVLTGASGINFYQSTLANSGLSGSGGLATWSISPQFTARVGYLAQNDAALQYFGNDGPANPQRGLFNSTNSLLAELTYSPSRDVNVRLLYSRAHLEAPPPPPLGSFNLPFFLTSLRGAVDDGAGGPLNDIIAHNFVVNFDWVLFSRFALFGRYSYSTSAIDPVNSEIAGGNVNLQAFQLGIALPDLGRSGGLGTLTAVIPFDVVSGQRFLAGGYGDGGTQIDVLASYYYPIGDHVALVPMVFATFSPNNFSANPPVYSTILRTQFLF